MVIAAIASLPAAAGTARAAGTPSAKSGKGLFSDALSTAMAGTGSKPATGAEKSRDTSKGQPPWLGIASVAFAMTPPTGAPASGTTTREPAQALTVAKTLVAAVAGSPGKALAPTSATGTPGESAPRAATAGAHIAAEPALQSATKLAETLPGAVVAAEALTTGSAQAKGLLQASSAQPKAPSEIANLTALAPKAGADQISKSFAGADQLSKSLASAAQISKSLASAAQISTPLASAAQISKSLTSAAQLSTPLASAAQISKSLAEAEPAQSRTGSLLAPAGASFGLAAVASDRYASARGPATSFAPAATKSALAAVSARSLATQQANAAQPGVGGTGSLRDRGHVAAGVLAGGGENGRQVALGQPQASTAASTTAASTAGTSLVDSAQVAQQVAAAAQRAATVMETGTASVRLQLDPPTLGHVQITLRAVQDGIVAVLRAENPAAIAALQGGQEDLRQRLAGLGFKASAVEVLPADRPRIVVASSKSSSGRRSG